MSTTDPLGPQAEAFRVLLGVCRDLTPAQLAALDEANHVFVPTRAEVRARSAAAGSDAPEAAHLRGLDAMHDSGRFQAAEQAGLRPGPAWKCQVAVLVSDLISVEDFAEMTAPWVATFGELTTDPS